MTSVQHKPTPRKKKYPKDAADAKSPHLLAGLIEGTYRFWAGDFCRYVGTHYEKVGEDYIDVVIDRTLEEVAEHYNDSRQFRATGALFNDLKRVFRTRNTVETGPEPLLAMTNGLLKLNDDGTPTLLSHDPSRFVVGSTGYPYVPGATSETWERFLGQVLPNDPELVAVLQEYAGYGLTYDTSMEKFLILLGEGANGKSVFLRVLKLLIGVENVSAVSYEDMGDRFAPYQTLHKRVNISPEIGRLDKSAEGRLKSFISGEPVMMDRKFRDPILATPTAKIVLQTNVLPHVSDHSDGFWRRIILAPFSVTIPKGERNHQMSTDEYWRNELAGILNWALEGLQRLNRNGRFTESSTVAAAVEQYKSDVNPARRFIIEEYEYDPASTDYTVVSDIFAKYQAFLDREGLVCRLSRQNFLKQLKRVFQGLPAEAPVKKIKGKAARVYVGLRRKKNVDAS